MNELANSTSPYLRQHAGNPVDWRPWSEAALAEARASNKPIFLSIGYAACHWCHVMAHETFEDPAIAAVMNEHFINIKVDREERPDLDSIYMQATLALTGSGGWPMSVFLTPELRPFYAGTYFPPTPRHGLPAFREVLLGIANAWSRDPGEARRVGDQLLQHLRQGMAQDGVAAGLSAADLDRVTALLLESYDWGYGGWGTAPKFPQPMIVEYLLRRALPQWAGREQSLKTARHALAAMARGGLYDVVGGGFARYSTDNFWRVPHFEKMLYDNAQLSLAYLHAWQLTQEPALRAVALSTLDFVSREMTGADGEFYSSLDADSEGQEGRFYVWTSREIQAALDSDADFDFFRDAYAITEQGNWEGKIVLQRALDDASLAARYSMDRTVLAARLADCHGKLLKARTQRPRPATDDKALAAWNGLMLQAYAAAARALGPSDKAEDYLGAATRNAQFLLSKLYSNGRLHRAWRAGEVTDAVFLEDFAALIIGLLELYQADFNSVWFAAAERLADDMLRLFADPAGGFFDTTEHGQSLLLRPKELQDSATPSGNAMACEALLKLAAFTDKTEYRDRAEQSLRLAADQVLRQPMGYGRWLSAADLAAANVKQIAVLYRSGDSQAQEMLRLVQAQYRPNVVLAASDYPAAAEAPALLAARAPLDGRATAYVCQHFVCQRPVTSVQELEELL